MGLGLKVSYIMTRYRWIERKEMQLLLHISCGFNVSPLRRRGAIDELQGEIVKLNFILLNAGGSQLKKFLVQPAK